MSSAHIVRESAVQDSFRVAQVCGMFDVPPGEAIRHEWRVSLPVAEQPWHVGLIVGSSGSGKSTIAREVFPHAYHHTGFAWDLAASILDGFPAEMGIRQITEALSSVGLSSPPMWLKPFGHLSNGQQFRAELARCLCDPAEVIVFDEFTSVVDRQVAQVCSAAVSKLIRRRLRPQLVAVSCHFDIIDWLQPDWVFDVNLNRFEWRCLRRHPSIELRINETPRETWQLFRGHHYLSANLPGQAKCYVATWNGEPVGFCGVMTQPHPTADKLMRASRLVVLPDYQGVGIGARLSEFVAAHYTEAGYRFRAVCAHPALIAHRSRSPLWKAATRKMHSRQPSLDTSTVRPGSTGRLTMAFEFQKAFAGQVLRGKAAQKTAPASTPPDPSTKATAPESSASRSHESRRPRRQSEDSPESRCQAQSAPNGESPRHLDRCACPRGPASGRDASSPKLGSPDPCDRSRSATPKAARWRVKGSCS